VCVFVCVPRAKTPVSKTAVVVFGVTLVLQWCYSGVTDTTLTPCRHYTDTILLTFIIILTLQTLMIYTHTHTHTQTKSPRMQLSTSAKDYKDYVPAKGKEVCNSSVITA
jgi:hypothetical protein